jgi:hypothetical protein
MKSTEPVFRPFTYLQKLPPEPDWLWRGYLAPSTLTRLSGHPFKGKSMLVGGLLKALERGDAFLGRETTAATALLISEEDEGVLRSRSAELGLLELKSEYIGRSSGVFGLAWHELIAHAAKRALAKRHRLLIIDTFPGLADLHDDQENHAGAIAERLRPLQDAAGAGLAVMFLHHMNGQGQPRGSKAFRGIVDISIRLCRNGNESSFHVDAESRFPAATPVRLRARLVKATEPWTYQVVGTSDGPLERANDRAQQSDGRTVDERLMDAVVAVGSEGITYDQINLLGGLSEYMAKRRLPVWHREKKIDRIGAGTKSDAYRWCVPSRA